MSVNAVGTVEQKQQSPLLYGVGGAAIGALGAGGARYGMLSHSLNRATATDATKETVDAFVKSGRVQRAVTDLASSTRSELETAKKGVLEFVNARLPEGAEKIAFEKYAEKDVLGQLTTWIDGNKDKTDDATKGLLEKAKALKDKLAGTPAVAEVKDAATGKVTTEAKKAVKGLEETAKEFTDALYTTKDGKEVLKEGDELTKGVGTVWKNAKESVTSKIKSMNKSSALKWGAIAAAAVGVVAAFIISNRNKKAAAEAQAQAQAPADAHYTKQV